METKHTPGAWQIDLTGDGKRIIVGKGLVEGLNRRHPACSHRFRSLDQSLPN